MSECLRCGKVCKQDVFCDDCQSALLRRSLQKDERREVLAPASLAVRASIAELNSRKSSVQKPVVQTSLLVPAQDVVGGREQDRLRDMPDEASLPVRQSATLAMSQALSPQHVRLSRLRRTFTIMVIIAVIVLIVDSILVSLVI